MSKKLLHTPEGVRDIYSTECEKKLYLENRLHQRLKKYGYRDIETPTFEFFDVFGKEVGTIASRELFKFFDREGNTLVLRPDFTPSVARSAAKYYMYETHPIRMCYMGNTFINNSNYQGRLKESTQLGAELLGVDTVDADAEMIAMIVELLQDSGLEDFQVSIGQIDYFKGLLEESGLDEDEEMELRELISTKNHFGIEEFLLQKGIKGDLKEALLLVPELFGGMDMLAKAEGVTENARSLSAIERLKAVYEVLKVYGLTDRVIFDLGLVSKYKYYTGVIFQAYTYGNGDAIVKGGRYDNLLSRFGKNSPAIGFVVQVDQLLTALSRQKIRIPVERYGKLLLYTADGRTAAIEKAKELRDSDERCELLCIFGGEGIEDYVEYANEGGYDTICLITGDGKTFSCMELTDKEER